MSPRRAAHGLHGPCASSAPGAPGAPNDAPGADAADAADADIDVAAEVRQRPRRARRYQVVLHNDDYTTVDFVVAILMKHFHKPPAEATHIMLCVHHKGAGVAGVYTRDVAETKAADVTAEARQHGMPLLLTVEPVEAHEPGGGGAADGDGAPGEAR